MIGCQQVLPPLKEKLPQLPAILILVLPVIWRGQRWREILVSLCILLRRTELAAVIKTTASANAVIILLVVVFRSQPLGVHVHPLNTAS